MSRLDDYYKLLLRWEGHEETELVSAWDPAEVEAIETAFVEAAQKSRIKDLPIPIVPGSENQSIGNQVADFFAQAINHCLQTHQIGPCSGAGYPDRVLADKVSGRHFPFELKATSSWNSTDSNRRVLTSSSKKLRANFSPPICHLLATCCYSESDSAYRLTAVRLDFIEPTTEVNIRLEASVSHRILANSRHKKLQI
jgi:hypothetical protein